MSDRKSTLGIGVEARVDKSVTRAFSQVEQQNRKLGKDANKLGSETTKLGQKSLRTGRKVTGLGRTFRKAQIGVKKYTRDVGRSIRKTDALRKSVGKLDDGLDAVGNQWTALASGAVGAGSAAVVMGLEERYERLGIQVGKSRDEMTSLREEMFATSQQSDIRVNQDELLFAVEKIVEKTGDLDFARENMANIGRVMQATGAAGVDVGEMFADMSQKFGLKNSADVLSAIDTLVVQGKAGAFTLQNLAAEGASVSAAYAAMGRTGPKAVQEMGAMLQISRMGSGSAAEAASAMESVLADITANYEDIEALGIQVFDEEALARGERKFRDLPSLVKEIMEATNSDITEYSQLFGDEAMRFMKVLSSADGKTAFDSFLAIEGNGTAVIQDSARAARTANAAMMSLKTAWLSFADENLAEPISEMADAINSLEPETLNTTLKAATGLAVGLGAAWAARKAWKIGSSVAGFFKGGKKGGAGSLPGLSGDVQNVYVTNMPMGGFGGAGTGGKSKTKGRKGIPGLNRTKPLIGSPKPITPKSTGPKASLARLPKTMPGMNMLKSMGRRLPVLGAVIGAVDIGNTLMDDQLSKKEKAQEVGGTVGQMGGMAAGAAAGAMMGSVVPIVGTAIGGVIGGIVGGIGLEKVGRWAGGWFGNEKRPKVGDSITNNKVDHHRNQYEGAVSNTTTVTNATTNTVQPVDTNIVELKTREPLPKVGDSITNHQVTNNSVVPIEAGKVEVSVSEQLRPKAGDKITNNNVNKLNHQQVSNTVNQVMQPQRAAPTQVSFSPSFQITGNVDDKQIAKLEKMVMRLHKQMSKMQNGGTNLAFAD
ncbi:phage tail tape measure protein [Vibrio sp. ER1A]|uniref:phage tail tape measure protein n=1 Tax=Vibrio sp. ER1A TaxID=1517681 RepID=UPI00068F2DF2|nr:phage tail tape measure protein [Vibrio sp. ER1A]